MINNKRNISVNMNKLIQRDKAILEYLTYKYGKEIVSKNIEEIKQKNNKLYNGK